MGARSCLRRASPKALRGLTVCGLMASLLPAAVAVAFAATPGEDGGPSRVGREGRGGGRRGADFEARGAVVGEPVGDLQVYTLDGAPRQLAVLWSERPLLLVTASITCPPSRNSMAELEAIAARFEGRLEVAVLYTLEAHPVGEASPYRPEGPEWVPPVNVRAGFDRPQPQSLEARLGLARELAQRFPAGGTVVVDVMANEAWRMLGGGPNMGFLIETDGTLAVKHGWFDAPSMIRSIEAELGA